MMQAGLDTVVGGVAGFALWLVANWAYLDFCRRGQRGLRRLAAFVIGLPATVVTAAVVGEGSESPLRDDDEGLEELFREVRRDRRLRGHAGHGPGPGTEGGTPGGDGTPLEP